MTATYATRVLWIAPDVEIPTQWVEFTDLPTTVIRIPFPKGENVPLCARCAGSWSAHTWQVTDGRHGPVVDCSGGAR